MKPEPSTTHLENVYSKCRSLVGPNAWNALIHRFDSSEKPETFPKFLENLKNKSFIPDYLPELAKLELTKYKLEHDESDFPEAADTFILNPTVVILQHSWRLASFLSSSSPGGIFSMPQKAEEYVLVWKHPDSGEIRVKAADDADLLALKVVAEDTDLEQLARSETITRGKIEETLFRAADRGILLAPASRFRRDTRRFEIRTDIPRRYLSARYFTLQWHITHACDLHCKHCYDRTKRSPLTLDQGYGI